MAQFRRFRLTPFLLVALAAATVSQAHERAPTGKPGLLRVVHVNEPDGQILSYRHLAGSTDVLMRGTRLAPDARIRLKIGSRPGFVELDINRGGIAGLKPAHRLGKDFLTYVLWAVSVDGKASNLGEITFEGETPVSVNLTTPYQTFWLMLTAEPNYAVVDPSQQVVLHSVAQGSTSENKALAIRGKLFFFTHYSEYESSAASALDGAPNQLLQARKAVELASKSGVFAVGRPGSTGFNEEEYTREAFTQAKYFLDRAEEAYRTKPTDQTVIQFARTSAQSAENARALAMGAVGGLQIRQLEEQLTSLRAELAKLKAASGTRPQDAEPSAATTGSQPPVSATNADPASEPVAPLPLVKQPALWFAVTGWAIALVLLFRRRSV